MRDVLEEYGADLAPDPDASRLIAKWRGLKDAAEKWVEEGEEAQEAAKEAGEIHSADEEDMMTKRWLQR